MPLARRRRPPFTALVALVLAASGPARADEGMWPLDALPLKRMDASTGFAPSPDWIAHVTRATARLSNGCSASFVAPDGLVLTDHHCVLECLTPLAPSQGGLDAGFTTTADGPETRCPGLVLDQLRAITDVTARVNAAVAGQNGAARLASRHRAEAAIEEECAAHNPADTHCEVVELYGGARDDLYRFRRFDDLRLVFAPDSAIADFGGDPDNFNYPRFDLDMAVLRAFNHGRPAAVEHLALAPAGPRDGEPVFTVGDPFRTERTETVDELRAFAAVQLPVRYGDETGLDAMLWQFGRAGPAARKDAAEDLYWTDNTLKVLTGYETAFADPTLLASKEAAENALDAWIAADPARQRRFGGARALINGTFAPERALFTRWLFLENDPGDVPAGFPVTLFSIARTLVRAADERAKPDADRLPEDRDASLPALAVSLFSPEPIHPDVETAELAWSLTRLRQVLGADDPLVRAVLGRNTPDAVAARAVASSRLADLAVRHALWNGGAAAVDASADPMIRLARAVDPAARAVRARWDAEVVAPRDRATALLTEARFARDGVAFPPDATDTPRLSFGTVRGWTADGRSIAPFTDFAGLARRATGSDPFALEARWRSTLPTLAPATPFDFTSTNDITGGNSGSPVLDRDARVVGLAFDGNLPSIAGDFVYDGADNRTVSLDTAAMLVALRQVYGMGWLADALDTARPAGAAPTPMKR